MRFFRRKRGLVFAICGVVLHMIYYLTAAVSVVWGAFLAVLIGEPQTRSRRSRRSRSSTSRRGRPSRATRASSGRSRRSPRRTSRGSERRAAAVRLPRVPHRRSSITPAPTSTTRASAAARRCIRSSSASRIFGCCRIRGSASRLIARRASRSRRRRSTRTSSRPCVRTGSARRTRRATLAERFTRFVVDGGAARRANGSRESSQRAPRRLTMARCRLRHGRPGARGGPSRTVRDRDRHRLPMARRRATSASARRRHRHRSSAATPNICPSRRARSSASSRSGRSSTASTPSALSTRAHACSVPGGAAAPANGEPLFAAPRAARRRVGRGIRSATLGRRLRALAIGSALRASPSALAARSPSRTVRCRLRSSARCARRRCSPPIARGLGALAAVAPLYDAARRIPGLGRLMSWGVPLLEADASIGISPERQT